MSRKKRPQPEQQSPKRPPGFLRSNLPKLLTGGLGLGAIAGVTGYVSYGHIKAVTLALGQPLKYANVWPLGVDGMVVVGSVVLLTKKKDKGPAWLCIVLGLIQSVAANIADGWSGAGVRDGWLLHVLAAGWAGFLALCFAAACFTFERWIVDLVADWRTGRPTSEVDVPAVAPTVPAPVAPPAVAPEPPVTPEPPPAPRPLPAPEPTKAAAPPAAVKPIAAKAPVVRQPRQPDDGQPRTCCAAHRSIDSGDKLDREQALDVFLGYRAAHSGEPRFQDLGGDRIAKIFGIGSKPARQLQSELADRAGSAPAQFNPGSTEPGLSGAGVADSPGGPGSPVEPGPAPTPAHLPRLSPGSTPATPAQSGPGSTPAHAAGPGSAGPGEPGLSDAEPAPAVLAGSGAAK